MKKFGVTYLLVYAFCLLLLTSVDASTTAPSSDDADTTASTSSDADTTAPSSDDADTAASTSSDADTTAPSSDDADTAASTSSDADTTAPSSDDADTAASTSSDADTTAPSSDDVDTSTFAPDDTERLDRIFDVKGIVGSGFLENSGRTLVLTTSNNQTSAMWAKEKLNFRKKFNIQAYVYLGNEKDKAADGLTLTFQGSGRKFIGKSGSGLGAYGAGGMNNISLEIDTYLNQDGYDEYLDGSFQQHIAIVDSWIDYSQKRHDAAERIRIGASEGKYNNVGISNGQWHSLNVLWNPETSELSYELLMKEVWVIPGTQHSIVRDRVIKNKKKILYPERFYGGAYWGFTAATGSKAARHAIAIKNLPQNLKIETKNSTLYVGQEWRASDNFVSATDLSGNSVSFDSSLITVDGDVDTSKPGTHKIKYTIEEEGIRKDSECTVEVKEDKTSLELNTGTHYIYQGEQWEPKRGFKKATDADGNNLSLDKIEKWWGGDKAIDPNKIGDERTYFYRVYKKNGSTIYNCVTVSVKENKTNIKTKDSTLYVGEKWNAEDNFVSATDEDGKEIPWEDSRITKNGASIDTSKPGVHKIKYTNKGKVKDVDSEFTVTVKEDKSSLKTKDSTLYVGQKWNPEDNFVSATDEDGKEIPWEDSRIIKNGASIDTSKPGVHKIKYTYKGKVKNVDSEFTVTVKEDKSSLKTKDSTLYVGQKWNPEDNFVSATDEDGKEIPWEDSRITKNGASIDTSKPGVHKIKYTYKGKVKNVDSEFTVTVKEDKTSLELNTGTHYIYQGEQWEPKRGFKKATDADGNNLSLDKIEKWWGGDKAIDPNKIGDERTYFYRVYKKNGSTIYNCVTVSVKENKTNIKTKDSTLYVGEKWNAEDNFVSATDEDGKEIPWEDSRITKNGASIDTSKPGVHKIKYTNKGKVKDVDSEFTVTVKEDKSSLKTKDSTLYVGQKWNPEDNFVSATDEDGKEIPWEDSRIIKNGASIDTSKPGVHKIKYTYKGKVKNVDSEFTVTVKEDKSSLKTKDSTLYVGQKWNPEDNFVSATDEDGKEIPWEDSRIIKNGASIDTSKPGVHKIKYTYKGKVKNVDSEFTVTVKEDKTSLELNTGTHYIYQGEQWEPKRGFKKATDADGNNLSLDKIEKWWGGDKAIDPNKIGDERTYFYRVYKKNGSTIYNYVTVSVKENKTNIKTKDSTLYVGEKWNAEDNFVSATDEDGKEIPWEDSRITKNGASIDTSKPGVHKIKYTNKGKVKDVDSEFTVTVKEDKSSLKTKDSTLYVGQKWNPEDNFVSATDEDGKEIPWEDLRITKNGASIDTSKPGVHKIKYTNKGKVKDVDSEFTVTVKEDKSSLKTKDSTLYVGQKWNPEDNFVSATDEDGKEIPWEDSRIIKNGASIDTGKPGVHKIKYTNKGKVKDVDSEFTVTVKEDKSSLKTKDSTLYVGQKWNPEDNFVSATDEDGKEIPWEDSRITKNGASIDTGKPGVHKIKYTNKGKVKDVDSTFTVTVKDNLTLTVSEKFNFNEVKKSNKEQVVGREEVDKLKVTVNDGSRKGGWRLTARINSSKDKLSPYVIFRDKNGNDYYLDRSVTNIYEQPRQEHPLELSKINIAEMWKKDTGILLKIPSKNPLASNCTYQTTITWNLVEGP